MTSKLFTVMWPWPLKEVYKKLDCPKTVPWAFIEPHEKQALDNHDQTLEQLHNRGGLDVVELRAVLEGKPWREVNKDETSAIQKLITLLHKWEDAQCVIAAAREADKEP